jgi:polysaccharide export outer membrane protein
VAAPPIVASARPDLDNLMYAGGGSAAPVAAPIAVVAPAPAAEAASVYTLDSGDRLRIVVFGQDGLSNSYIVDAAGNITMPLIGSVPARDTSTSELARVIGARLRNGFIREPHVAIEVESYRPFFILGEVTYPGQYPYVPNMTVETAVAIAGGFTPRAYRWEVKVARNMGGRPFRMAVPPTYALRPGDTVTIDERWF